MDYSKLDQVRRGAVPLQLDTIEAFTAGRLSRREFIQRASMLGISATSIGLVLAACSNTPASPAASAAGGGGTSAAPSAAGSAAASAAASAATGGTIRVAIQRPVSVDPVAMQDLGGYGIVSQSMEFLCTLTPKDLVTIGPGLATEWTPNADGSVWTFKLRPNVKWHDGTPFTADDVVATMERLVAAGNSGLKGVLPAGGAKATDANTVTMTLASPNGNFPYLVSVFNAQTVITPKAYAAGTTLDKVPAGTGAWKLKAGSYNTQTGATFERNPDWWGGTTPLDGIEFTFFDATGPMVTAYQGQQVDAIVQFDVLSGKSLIDDANFNLIAAPAALHRQIWMRCDKGQFADKRVRQALAYTFDRPALIQQLFQGKAQLGNDHVIWEGYPYFDSSVPQRTVDTAKAKQLLTDAGVSNLTATLHAGQLLEIPDLATLLKSQAAAAGITLNVAVESLQTYYGAQWCPAQPADPPCSGAAELGIVDYGHRGTPDVYLNAALKSKGIWNSSQYSSPDFDNAFLSFQKAVGVDAQKAACKQIETILLEDTPIGLPYFYNYLAGSSKSFSGFYASGLGQAFFSSTSKTA
jgi:peptide/nickel transport system substrate-binding protein